MITLFVFLLVVTALFAGCGDDAAGPEPNEKPTITLLTTQLAVGTSSVTTLNVSVSDADNDPLTVTWSTTGGSLNQQDQGSTQMRWTASATVGVDTIKALVSDGKEARMVQVEFKVGTLVTTDIIGVVNWSAAQSPYVVNPSELGGESRLAVRNGGTLNIPAGVMVYCKPEMIFDVEGTLATHGESGNLVKFYPNLRSPESGAWFGFRAQTQTLGTPGKIDMEYTEVAYGTRNVHAIDDSNVHLKNTLLLFAAEAGLYFESGGYAKLEGCTVNDNYSHGIWVDGGMAITPDSIVVVDSEVSVNGQSGISINFSDAFGVIPIRIYHNQIQRNISHGIHLLYPCRPRINQNSIHTNDRGVDNALYRRNIVLESPFIANFATINATNNYWVTTDPLVIAGGIHDSADDPVDINVSVTYEPFLSTWP